MSDHYFTERPTSAHREVRWRESLRGRTCDWVADAGVFSIGRIDRGTRLLVESVRLAPHLRVLDLGCGYGAIGVAVALAEPLASVVMTDVNERAAQLARRNAAANGAHNADVRRGDGFEAVRGARFDLILTNPPVRAGKRIVYAWIDEAPRHLRPGGRFCAVVRTRQGAKSFERRLGDVFGRVDEIAKGAGYRLFCATIGI